MFRKIVISVLFALMALVVPAGALAAHGAIVFSQVTSHRSLGPDGEPMSSSLGGGLFAFQHGHRMQLTDNPADSEPSFSADGRTITFSREGDIWAMRADGSGQRQLTTGSDIDSRPLVAPNGRIVLFERNRPADSRRDLFTVRVTGGAPHPTASSTGDEHEASFSPDGRTVVFVKTQVLRVGGTEDDIFTVRPSGAKRHPLTRTGLIDEFAPKVLNETIVYSRGESDEGPSAYADIYAMDQTGKRIRKLIAGASSAYVEDVTANGRSILFRRDQGLWVKRLGGKGRKLAELPDNSQTNSAFSSDGRKVATFTAIGEVQSLSVIDVAGRRTHPVAIGMSVEGGESHSFIGSVFAWQPVPRRR